MGKLRAVLRAIAVVVAWRVRVAQARAVVETAQSRRDISCDALVFVNEKKRQRSRIREEQDGDRHSGAEGHSLPVA
jgi:hypothetical protein